MSQTPNEAEIATALGYAARLRAAKAFWHHPAKQALVTIADALEALREAVKGCGTVLVADGDESITCGSQECADEPDFCAACTARVWTAIATLTQGDE